MSTAATSVATPPTPPSADATRLERVLFEIKRVIVGQDRLVERMLVALLAKGHVLLEGVPGLAKTLAVETLAEVVGGTFVRIQFTPDLIPSDLVGTRIYRASTRPTPQPCWGRPSSPPCSARRPRCSSTTAPSTTPSGWSR